MEIKDTAKFYKKNRYVLIKKFISKEQASYLYNYGIMRANRAATLARAKWPGYREDIDGTFTDKQVPGTYSCYADPAMETLLLQGLDGMRKITGLNLAPTYSYWRLYKNGDVLKRHKDRPSCEISTTICIGYDNSNVDASKYPDWDWPMFIKEKNGKEIPIHMKPGDMIIYRGCEVEHWREPLWANNHAQVFLHYNEKGGKYDVPYDGRPLLGMTSKFRSEDAVDKNDRLSHDYVPHKEEIARPKKIIY